MLARKRRKGNTHTARGTVNWYSHCRKQYGVFSKKLKGELPYNPAVPLLATDIKENKTLIWKHTCIPMFIAALSKISRIWKKPVSINRWMDKEDVISHTHTYTHTHTHAAMLLSHKKDKILPFTAIWMDLEGILLSEITQQEKTNAVWYHLFVESKKCQQNSEYNKKEVNPPI